MLVGSFSANAANRKHSFPIPFNCSRLKLTRTSSSSALGDMIGNVPEHITVEHQNKNNRKRSEIIIRTPLGPLALVAVLGEKQNTPNGVRQIIPACPIVETYDTITQLYVTEFIIQLTPGNALHTDGDNILTLLLDDAFVSDGKIVDSTGYTLTTNENPLVMPYFNKVEVLPTTAGPVEHNIQANLFRFLAFPSLDTIINRIELVFSNGLSYDYTIADLLRDTYENCSVFAYGVTKGNFTPERPASPLLYFPKDLAWVVLDCANISAVNLHTDGSIIPVVTFAVDSISQ